MTGTLPSAQLGRSSLRRSRIQILVSLNELNWFVTKFNGRYSDLMEMNSGLVGIHEFDDNPACLSTVLYINCIYKFV